MTLADVALLALFGLTALNWTIHWYTQTVTYSLFPELARRMSGADFVAYHRAYQGRLIGAIYIPWSLLTAASVVVVAMPSAGAGIVPWMLLVLNVAIGILSVAFAVPVHRRIDREARLTDADAHSLLRANLTRLAAATTSLLLCAWLAVRTFAASA